MNILTFGEIIWDIYPDKYCIGGAPLNFAAHAVKSGANAFLLSAVGNDDLGKKALDEIKRFQVDTQYVGVHSSKVSGQCIVTLDEFAVPCYQILSDVAYDYISLPATVFSERFDALTFGTLVLRSAENRSALKRLITEGKFDKLYCDLNLREPFYDKDTVAFCLEHANIVKLSETELDFVKRTILKAETDSYQDAMRLLAETYQNLEIVLLTCGEKGAYAYVCQKASVHYCPAAEVKVVSTVGAGDSFGAVFLVNYLSGKEISECMKKATERSAYVISHVEAIPD